MSAENLVTCKVCLRQNCFDCFEGTCASCVARDNTERLRTKLTRVIRDDRSGYYSEDPYAWIEKKVGIGTEQDQLLPNTIRIEGTVTLGDMPPGFNYYASLMPQEGMVRVRSSLKMMPDGKTIHYLFEDALQPEEPELPPEVCISDEQVSQVVNEIKGYFHSPATRQEGNTPAPTQKELPQLNGFPVVKMDGYVPADKTEYMFVEPYKMMKRYFRMEEDGSIVSSNSLDGPWVRPLPPTDVAEKSIQEKPRSNRGYEFL